MLWAGSPDPESECGLLSESRRLALYLIQNHNNAAMIKHTNVAMPIPMPVLAPVDNPESGLVWVIPLTSVPFGPVLIADGAVVLLAQKS